MPLRKYGHPQIKKALVALFSGKCAYCESKITHVSYPHIEHFKPKSLFPEQTFEWTNLFLACGLCNGPNGKGERFPSPAEGGPPINPCEEEPSDHLEFSFDPVVRLASVYGTSTRGTTTVTLMDLNRPDLRAHRSAQVRRFVLLAKLAARDGEAAELLEEACQSSCEYAAFARAVRVAMALHGERRSG